MGGSAQVENVYEEAIGVHWWDEVVWIRLVALGRSDAVLEGERDGGAKWLQVKRNGQLMVVAQGEEAR